MKVLTSLTSAVCLFSMTSLFLNYYDEDDAPESTFSFSLSADLDIEREPVSAGRNITILPAGSSEKVSGDMLTLYLDSDKAFGDGSHPTTLLCLAMLEDYLESMSSSERGSVNMLDIGTGTGVLAILASLMGVEDILALDLDPSAVESAIELASINKADNVDFRVMDAANLPPLGTYGVITANLLPPVLRIVIPLSAKLALPGAPVIVSGIGDSSRVEMERLMIDSGFTEIRRVTSGWWQAYMLKG